MQYDVMFNEKSNTVSLKDIKGDTGNPKALTQITYGELGEVPDAASHPEPLEHIKNQLRILGVDIKNVTIKNDTDNDRLDKFERTAADPAEEPEDVLVINDDEEKMVTRSEANEGNL